MIDIFLSRPTWVDPKFKKGLDGFLSYLKTLDLMPRSLGTSEHPVDSPLDEVIDIMSECKGAIILGYPQIEVLSGTMKNENIAKPFYLPTEWNHIEAGLAYARKLPLLIIHHEHVIRGIFDRGAINKYIYQINLADHSWPLSIEISGALKTWKNKVLKPRQPQSNIQFEGNICPNCSSAEKQIFLSPLPRDFMKIEGATHECTKCGFKLEKQ